MKKIAIILLIVSNISLAKEIKRPTPIDKKYIDFQVYGTTIFQGDNIDQSSASSSYKNIAYTFTNVDIDFNFSKNLSIVTQTSIQNRKNGFSRPYAMTDYTNNNNTIGTFFTDTSLTSRMIALQLHNKKTSLTIGKIRPRAGIANGVHSQIITEDWYGIYGAMMDGGYTNTNKIGAEFHTEFSLIPHSTQTLEIALFKNDTTALDDAAFGTQGVYGYTLPRSLDGIIAKREAGNTFAPSSFSILATNESELIGDQKISYSGYYRKQDVDKQSGDYLAPETTIAASLKYEKTADNITFGLFGNVASVSNVFGVKDLSEKYYTASAYTNIDNFVIAFAYNIYSMNDVSSININGVNKSIAGAQLSQSQISFGYKFNKAYKFDIAYRQLTDGKSQKSAQGVGVGLRYNIGTRHI